MWGQQEMQGRNFGPNQFSNQFQGEFSQNNQFQGGFSQNNFPSHINQLQGNSLFNNQFQSGVMYRQYQGKNINANQMDYNPTKRKHQEHSFRRLRIKDRKRKERRYAKKQKIVEVARKKEEANKNKGGEKHTVEPEKEKEVKIIQINKRNRPILGIPLEIKWPTICLEDVRMIKEKFVSTFEDNVCDQYLAHVRAKMRKVHPTFNEEQINRNLRKRALRLNRYKDKDHLDKRIANLDSAKIKRLTDYGGFTMHAVTKVFETEKMENIALVMVHKGHDVRFLPQHILLLCQLNEIPACSIEGLEPLVCKMCDVTRSFGVYFKKHIQNPFQEFIDFVIRKIPNINRDIPGVDSLSEVLVPILKKNSKETIEISEVVVIKKEPNRNDNGEGKENDDTNKEKENQNQNNKTWTEKKDKEKLNEKKENATGDGDQTSDTAEEKSQTGDTAESCTKDVEDTKKADVEGKKQTGTKRKIQLAEPNVTRVTEEASPKNRRTGRKK